MEDDNELQEVEVTATYTPTDPDYNSDMYTVLQEQTVTAKKVPWLLLAGLVGVGIFMIMSNEDE